LVILYFKIKKYLFLQEVLTFRYYKNLKFAFTDILQKLIYGFVNPYRVSKKFLIKNKSQDIHMYGETPISIFGDLLKSSGLSKKDTFFELGCGRGRLCYFVSLFYECNVVGIEQIPTFIKILRFLKKIFRINNLKIINQNMFDVDYSTASFIYLYGTCLKDNEIFSLIDKFKNLKKNSKILTISTMLSVYDESFKLLKKYKVNLPWGSAFAYLFQKD